MLEYLSWQVKKIIGAPIKWDNSKIEKRGLTEEESEMGFTMSFSELLT